MPAGSAPAGDPLVLPLGSSFGAWFAKVQEVARRSWKSALIISAIGIAAPYAISALFSQIFSWGGYTFTRFNSLFDVFADLVLGWLVSLVIAIAGCYVAAAGWAPAPGR